MLRLKQNRFSFSANLRYAVILYKCWMDRPMDSMVSPIHRIKRWIYPKPCFKESFNWKQSKVMNKDKLPKIFLVMTILSSSRTKSYSIMDY